MSKQTLTVIVNGKEYQVEVADVNASPLHMTVNGNTYVVEIPQGSAPLPPTAPAVVEAIPAAKPAAPTVRAVAPSVRTAVNAGGQVLAPMPGVILDILVRPGDDVKKGDTLCSLEAMKMKSAIRSPQDGTVAAVEVSDGQKVNHNDVLIRFA